MAAYANTEFGELIENAPKSVVAGERLNVELLRRFYARHGFAPVWTTRQSQANSLMNAVLRAGDHGLAPELFHANLLRSPATLPTLDRELLLSDAFLSYADALARGVMPVERRRDDETLTPEPIDVAAALDAAIDSPDPAAVIEALAPTTPTYRLLRQALQDFHAGIPVGGKTATTRLREIEVNLERERWLPRRLPADRVWVNVADQRLVLYRDDRPVFSTRVIVGQDARAQSEPGVPGRQSIEFCSTRHGTSRRTLPPTRSCRRPGTTRIIWRSTTWSCCPMAGCSSWQDPTQRSGHLLFEMKNRFDVYLHDTPSKNLFSRDDRRISHGCIRVENPQKLAALLMQQPIDAINQTIATGNTTRSALPKPVPVFVVYETAFADVDDRLQFRADIYGRDAEIWRYLDPKRRAVADREAADRRGRRP